MHHGVASAASVAIDPKRTVLTASCWARGNLPVRGDLVPPILAKRRPYLEQAAYYGDPRAALLLGQIYRLGRGVSADPIEAYAWSEVASLEGSAFAKRERDASLRSGAPRKF